LILRGNGPPTAGDAFHVCIHRGTQQIGGTCIELTCGVSRVLLDLGLPLAMLMEGSSLGRLGPDQGFPSEEDIEARLADAFRAPGFVGVCASAQNIDRIVSIYRACKRTGRTLVLDLYAAEVLAATGNPNIPQAGWPNVAVYVPEYQRRHVKRTERFDLTERYKPHRIFREVLAPMGRAP